MCRNCFRTFPQYNTTVTLCQVCAYNKYKKPGKPISKIGKRTKEYNEWRINVAIPYLDKTYGHKCNNCGATGALDIDHIKPRGSNPQLKMQLNNIQYLCRSCHIKKTIG